MQAPPDFRRATEADLLGALADGEPLALAEAYARTASAAHAVARRLLGRSGDVETLLRDVYGQLWDGAPESAALEAWVRGRCFALGAQVLRERAAAPAAASLALLLPDLPAPTGGFLDGAERAVAELPEGQRRALLLAHDRGIASLDQEGDGAAAALNGALATLAGLHPPHGRDGDCDESRLADWVLGLLPADEAAAAAVRLESSPGCQAWAKTLRRGRRRLEGLPPSPDLGHRVLVGVLAASLSSGRASAGPALAPRPPLPSALDSGGAPDHAEAAAVTATSAEPEPVPTRAAAAGPGKAAPAAAGAPGPADAAPATVEPPPAPAIEGPAPAQAGRRVLSWLLATLVIAVGVGVGVLAGLALWPLVLERFF